MGALRRYDGHEAEFIDVYRQVASGLEAAPRSEDATDEAERLKLRETVAAAITAADGR